MDDRLSRLAADVDTLSRSVQAIERRLAIVERALAGVAAVPGSHPSLEDAARFSEAARVPAATPPPTAAAHSHTALLGRSLVVLGGAYLLRSLTDSNVLPIPVGIALGFIYACVWMLIADRSATVVDATYHSVTSTLIALPILWEASFRFALVGPPLGALALGAFTALSLVVAARRRLQAIAWVPTIGATSLALALAIATRGYLSYAFFLIALGVVTVWYGYVLDWIYLRWPVALVANVAMIGIAGRGAAGYDVLPGLLLQMALVSGYIGSFAVRTLVLGRGVIPFEVTQSVLALVLGFGGAVYVTSATGANVSGLGLAALALGGLSYGVAFAFVEGRQPARNFVFYSSLALTFVLVGAVIAFGPDGAAVLFALLAVTTGLLARRVSRVSLSVHCAAYLWAGALASELARDATHALLAPAASAWHVISIAGAIVFTATLVCVACPMRLRPPSTDQRAARATMIALAIFTVAGAIVMSCGPLFARANASGDAGAVAALRTSVLVVLVVSLAWALGRRRLPEARWLLSPLLILIGLRLVLDDLPHGRATTLFIAFAAYGTALIVAPRLARSAKPEP